MLQIGESLKCRRPFDGWQPFLSPDGAPLSHFGVLSASGQCVGLINDYFRFEEAAMSNEEVEFRNSLFPKGIEIYEVKEILHYPQFHCKIHFLSLVIP